MLTGGRQGFLGGRLKTEPLSHTVTWPPTSLVQTQDRAPEVLEAATWLNWDGLERREGDAGAVERSPPRSKMFADLEYKLQ